MIRNIVAFIVASQVALAIEGPGCGANCGEWDTNSSHYITGDVVTYDGNSYSCQWWTNGKPGVDAAWLEFRTTTTKRPTIAPEPTTTPPPSGIPEVDVVVDKLYEVDHTFLSLTPTDDWIPSTVYKWAEMIPAIRDMASTGVGEKKLYVGPNETNGFKKGLVNIAAFLAQGMQETIQYNACDENNWSDSKVIAKQTAKGKNAGQIYPASAACGQLGQSYQDYTCSPEEAHMQCDFDPDMEIRAVTHATWYAAPGPLFCAPRSKTGPTKKWNLNGWCSPSTYDDFIGPDASVDEFIQYMNDLGTCREYKDQKGGSWENCGDNGCENQEGVDFGQESRTDVEGCCWWGRGVIQTTGICNFGKLNYYMGSKAAERGVSNALYPDINFCTNPEIICQEDGPIELKWIAGLFYWLESVQPYSADGWNYMEKLTNWVDNGMNLDDTAFIDGASGIVNRGCPLGDCGTGDVDALPERRENFKTIIEAMHEILDSDHIIVEGDHTSHLPTASPTTIAPTRAFVQPDRFDSLTKKDCKTIKQWYLTADVKPDFEEISDYMLESWAIDVSDMVFKTAKTEFLTYCAGL